MARYTLLPGMGGRYDIVLAMTTGGATKTSDELDCSQCAQIAFQVKTWAAGNLSVQVKQSFDGTNFKELVAAAVKVAGDTIVLDATQGPFGILEIVATSSDTTANATITMVGFPMQVNMSY